VASGWQGNASDRMKVRGYCATKSPMPSGKSFAGEKLLIDFNTERAPRDGSTRRT